MAKVEVALNKQFLLLLGCFKLDSVTDFSKDFSSFCQKIHSESSAPDIFPTYTNVFEQIYDKALLKKVYLLNRVENIVAKRRKISS